MPRFSKRRYKRKPKARKRIDKLQNKRLSRLEESIEKKFAQQTPTQVLVSSHLGNTEQIYKVIPQAIVGTSGSSSVQASGIIGNEMSLRNVKVRFQLTNTLVSGADVRVIFFWNICPRFWSVSAATPTSTAVTPTWPQLIHDFDGEPSATNGRVNMVTGRQLISAANKSPILVLSDKVIHLGGRDSSNSSKALRFSKSYKSMKLRYNNFEGATGTSLEPVNRQLFMAVLPCHTTETVEDPTGTVYLSYASQMHYTDA